ncbi:MAG: TlpA family protein disulfide reductase [Thermoleophilaceae bacterium]
MPEDRFDDLGPRRAGQSAAERLAELDEKRPEPDAGPPEPRRPAGRYSWVLGVAAIILIVVVGAKTLPHSGEGLKGLKPGMSMPVFAAASATGSLDAPPNIKRSVTDKRPGKHPACEVRGPGIVNLCQLRTKPLVLALIVPGPKRCEQQLDTIQRVAPSYPAVNFAAVVSGRGRGSVGRLVRKRGWTFPVAVDQQLILFNLYRAAICPTISFAYRGGRVRDSTIHPLSEAQLRTQIAAIERGRQ